MKKLLALLLFAHSALAANTGYYLPNLYCALTGCAISGNVSANNFIPGLATTTNTGGITTLTVNSPGLQYFTGSFSEEVKMPVVSTLTLGQGWYISNGSSASMSIYASNGSSSVASLPAGQSLYVYCVSLSGVTAASWEVGYALVTPNTYVPLAGTGGNPMSGDLGLGGHNLTNVGNIEMGGGGAISGLYEISAATTGGPIYVINSNFNLDGNPLTAAGSLGFLGGATLSEGPAPYWAGTPADATNFYDQNGNLLSSFLTDPGTGDQTFTLGVGVGAGGSAYLQTDNTGSVSLNSDPTTVSSVVNFTAGGNFVGRFDSNGFYVATQIEDGSDVTSLDTNNRTAYDGSNALSFDWQNRYLSSYAQDAVIQWDDGNGNIVFIPDSGDFYLQGDLSIGLPGFGAKVIDSSGNVVPIGFGSPSTTDSSTSTPRNNLAVHAWTRLTGSATITLNGIAAGFDGQIIYITNLTGNNLTITNNSGSATGKPILVPGLTGTKTASTGDTVGLIYDATTTAWRLMFNF